MEPVRPGILWICVINTSLPLRLPYSFFKFGWPILSHCSDRVTQIIGVMKRSDTSSYFSLFKLLSVNYSQYPKPFVELPNMPKSHWERIQQYFRASFKAACATSWPSTVSTDGAFCSSNSSSHTAHILQDLSQTLNYHAWRTSQDPCWFCLLP